MNNSTKKKTSMTKGQYSDEIADLQVIADMMKGRNSEQTSNKMKIVLRWILKPLKNLVPVFHHRSKNTNEEEEKQQEENVIKTNG